MDRLESSETACSGFDGRAVGVEPATQPAGLQLRERTGEPVVAALEVRAVGRVVVGRRDDREIGARRRRCRRRRACRSPWCRRSGRRRCRRRACSRTPSVPPVPGMIVVPTAAPVPAPSTRAMVGRSVWYLAYSGALVGHEAVEAVVAAVEVDHDDALAASARPPARPPTPRPPRRRAASPRRRRRSRARRCAAACAASRRPCRACPSRQPDSASAGNGSSESGCRSETALSERAQSAHLSAWISL